MSNGVFGANSPDFNWNFEPGLADDTSPTGTNPTIEHPLAITGDVYQPASDDGAAAFGTLLAQTAFQQIDPIPIDDGPEAVRIYAESLTADEQESLVLEQPHIVGSTDGFPAQMRYDANRILMENALVEAQAAGDTERAETLEGLLADPNRQFLFFDPEGDGRIAEVHGGLDDAEHVTTVIPGITNTLDNFQTFTDNTARLQAESTLLAPPGESTATIAWLGYDTPGLANAPFNNTAEDSGPLLTNFVDGLLLDDSVTSTIVAHSYGTVVTSHALQGGLEVDNVTVLGSPGMEVDNLGELDLPAGTDFYAGRAPGDYVSWSENFGTDPSDPRFGAPRITTGEGDGGQVRGHSSYFMAGSESLSNLAYIATDQDNLVETRSPGFSEWVAVGADEVHEFVFETPVNTAQDFVSNGVEFQRFIEDQVEQYLPEPVADVVDTVQDIREDGLEFVNRTVDFFQRVSSPDFWSDIASDIEEMGFFGWLGNQAQGAWNGLVETGKSLGGQLIDGGLDAGGWVIDQGLDAGGWVLDRSVDFGGWTIDRGVDAYDTAADAGGALLDGGKAVVSKLNPFD